ncbi:MAG: bifunctional diaminohydroxyphosphoribosylaminopyrimidine deaminase/5-amino-6-(5-phosphoribosylamino)uracil reductase RibD [Planctomycetota bacterium]
MPRRTGRPPAISAAAAMKRALALAARAGIEVDPNPRVGCVIVRDGFVVGEGFHRRYGGPHAEVEAVLAAGSLARGATAFVTLEPCAHRGKTGPCTEALALAGIARVVYAMEDPDARVRGRGLSLLARAGIRVSRMSAASAAARRLNQGYLARLESKRPWVLAKWAMTLDGQIAAAGGDSKWITSKDSRAAARALRAECDAVLVGVGTVLADNPGLSGWTEWGRPIARIVLDSLARTPLSSRLVRSARRAPLWIAASRLAPAARVRALEAAGALVLRFPGRRPPLGSVLRAAFRAGLRRVMVEGGGETLSSLFRLGSVDRIAIFMAPKIAGGRRSPLPDIGIRLMRKAISLDNPATRRIGSDWFFTGAPSGRLQGGR